MVFDSISLCVENMCEERVGKVYFYYKIDILDYFIICYF